MEENTDKFDLEFDTEKFIEEIKNRPAIWDSESPEYANREMKKKAWEDVINIFGGENLSSSQRRIMQITMRRKWKGLRGCFTRELRRQENLRVSGDPGARKSEYTHFKQLLFLRNVVTTKTSTSENDEYLQYEVPIATTVKKENPIDKEYNSEDNEPEFLEETSSEYSKMDEANVEFLDKDPLRDVKRLKLKKPRIDAKTEDEDLLFLLSMLKTLQRVPFRKKMATKIKLMAVLDEATRDLED
ncbi:uncharacterized protein LOC123868636 [Maniola jurtina]|uniref:uncharacterized protein LOC123868636 n=1 Tax=Maniola jurtina TaxID=191418 RepID=UPI001E68BB91|nr:uncharacterized protein LOC123868636 [Maniola jurtina]